MKQSYLFLLFFFLLLVSCSETTTQPSQEAWNKPGVGTSYVFSEWDLDSSFNIVPGTERIRNFSITGAGLSLFGRTNAFIAELQNLDTLYFLYDDRNDFYFYRFYKNTWFRYPVFTKEPNLPPTFDTTYTSGERWVSTEGVTYEGADTINVLGETLNAAKVRDLITWRYYDSLGVYQYKYIDEYYYWFVPSIGYYGKYKFTETIYDPASTVIIRYGWFYQLKSYILKKVV